MGATMIGVAVHAISLLISMGVVTEEEVKEANKKGNDGVIDLLKEKGKAYDGQHREIELSEGNEE